MNNQNRIEDKCRKDDRGSATVEMCLIAPIVVCVLFVIINMLFIAFNKCVAVSETYTVIYNRNQYGIDENGEGDICAAEMSMGRKMCDIIISADDVSTQLSLSGGTSGRSALFESSVTGDLSAETAYSETYVGAGWIVDDESESRRTLASQELRNVGQNLRRWQIYAELLSE